MKRKGGGDGGGGETWLNTYADMVTLLLTFFIVLFSMSSVEQSKFEAVVRSITGSDITNPKQIVVVNSTPGSAESNGYQEESGGGMPDTSEKPTSIDELYQYLKAYVSENSLQDSVDVSKSEMDNTVYIRFSNDMMFNPDRYDLTTTGIQNLNFLGDALLNMQDKVQRIQAEGYTADTQIANYPVDSWRLSSERAASVVIHLNNVVGLDKNLFVAMGYGERFPIGDNSTEEGRKLNRRVELTVVGEKTVLETSSLSGMYDSSRYPANGDSVDDNKGGGSGQNQDSSPASSEPVSEASSSTSSGVSPYDT